MGNILLVNRVHAWAYWSQTVFVNYALTFRLHQLII